MSFKNFNLCAPIQKALEEQGYDVPTPIQTQAIPVILEENDVLGCAQTGTGKTAAFSLPVLQNLLNSPYQPGIKVLVLAPTRELATQINDSIRSYGKYLRFSTLTVFGGVSQHNQVLKLKQGVDILIATPGRLLDLMEQGYISLSKLKVLILDEADRMLDMGFINDIKKIVKRIPADRQTLFFSATMAGEILQLATSMLRNPVKIQVTPVSSTAATVEQSVYFVDKGNKKSLLQHLILEKEMRNVLVFTKTKHGADKVAHALNKFGITSEAIHGNKSQNARQRALDNFKGKRTTVLVATDIAARGIDVTDLEFVINFELPNVPETYVHRIGRTGRAGANGHAFSFCDHEEKVYLRDIQKVIKRELPVVAAHPFAIDLSVQLVEQKAPVARIAKKKSFGRRKTNFRFANNY